MGAPYVVKGTRLMVLPPSAIVSAACADIERRAHNAACLHISDCQPYAFHRRHVVKALKWPFAGPADIIKVALGDLAKGQRSSKGQTRALYEDVQALRAALELSQ